MTHYKVSLSNFQVSRDAIAKTLLIAVFAIVGAQKLLAICSLIWWNENGLSGADRAVHVCAHVSALAFIVLLIAFTSLRPSPYRSAGGIEARISAIVGTFLACTLGFLAPAELPPWAGLCAIALSGLSAALSAYVLLWLGRSFSLTAQARNLVTTGPYGLVRHPLYLCEEIMVLALTILFFSPVAMLIAAIHWAFQLRRMRHEETLLRAVFEEYADYAARTPMVLPRFCGGRFGSMATFLNMQLFSRA
jgi:protein-S-isoprenylcysteine O-methyltransferase Ste14